jgi:7-keto-8-aminopelargonate synthetase-like enzyme
MTRETVAVGDLRVTHDATPIYDNVIEEIDGRRIRIGRQWLTDFASCNYLGFDLEPQIIDAVDAAVRRWGTHPSWSRLLGNPRAYLDIEERLTALLGCEDSLVLPTISHIHLTVLPVLAGRGWVFMDAQAHRTIYDGCRIAEGRGATLVRYPAGDVEALGRALAAAPAGVPRLVCTDGVNSMTGNVADLPALAAVAREHGALLYVDDAHGFGVIGERSPADGTPYGRRGNSIVRFHDETYDDVVLVGGFSKAYSSLLAFVALPTPLKEHVKTAASPYLYSGPSPTASLATVLAGFDVNDARGDEIRERLHGMTARLLGAVDELGLATANRSGLPIVELPLADADDLPAVWRFLIERGIYTTPAAYPLVPRADVGFRVQLTAANTTAEVDELCDVLRSCATRFRLRRKAGDDLP